MSPDLPVPQRFIGLDIHKHYLVAVGVDAALNRVLGPQRVGMLDIQPWIAKTLTPQDRVVIEMTTNTWEVYDELLPHVHSVVVVHPPHVKLVTQPQVMTDKIAASHLARLLAKDMLVSIWIPPEEVRQQRMLVAQRSKMVRLATQAKNRLHATLHRHHFPLPEGDPFSEASRTWWLNLPLGLAELTRVQSDLETLAFARRQTTIIENSLYQQAAQDERLPLLVQLPGVALLTAQTILAAIGDIQRFPDAKHLVGYAGLGGRVHDSGQSTRTGKITKAGRRDLRAALVEAAQTAANTHPFWKAELARLEPRLGRNKAIVAIARKLLVTVWHVLSHHAADKHAEPERVARKFLQIAYALGKNGRSPGLSPATFARQHLDRLGLARDIDKVPWGVKKKPVPLPPSSLPPD